MYEHMIRISVMDKIMYDIQRQGRISFYMTCSGEEATHTGSAVSLKDQDVIFAQYREQGVLMWRGFNMEQMMHQCLSNARDLGKGLGLITSKRSLLRWLLRFHRLLVLRMRRR
jgi:2-oxoisovalerate dehydrogenase E1 component alpha subunit